MDQHAFDQMARLLGGGTTRRAGVTSALAAAIGFAVVRDGDAVAGRPGAGHGAGRRPGSEGPCGSGSRKDNSCTKDSQCCTGYCQLNLKNKDRKGRCRCIRKGRSCTAKQTCCGALTCTNGVCGGSAPEVCDVCLAGCAYSAIQPAVAAAAAGATIRIGGGTYRETVTVDRSLTLKACNGETVTWHNGTDGQRALVVPRADPGHEVVIDGITFTSDTTSGGGIWQWNGSLTLSGTTTVTGCTAVKGGGVQFGDGNKGGALVLEDTALVTANTSDSYGGGIFLDSYATLEMRGNAAVTNNTAGNDGGGVMVYYGSSMTMRDDATVSGNTASGSSNGGGIYIYGGGVAAFLEMHDRSRVTGNASEGSNQTFDGGGGIYVSSGSMTMDGDTVISGNTAAAPGGGVFTEAPVTMSGNASITQNTATSGGGMSGKNSGALTKTPPASITGNTPDQCGGTISC